MGFKQKPFMSPDMYREMQVDTRGEFGGLGIQIGIKDGMLTVIAPLEDTPAFRIGIKAGDKILKINDELTKDMSLHDAVGKMRGIPSTSVKITIIREGWKETRDFTIVREIIKIQSGERGERGEDASGRERRSGFRTVRASAN